MRDGVGEQVRHDLYRPAGIGEDDDIVASVAANVTPRSRALLSMPAAARR
jgi:hypothetical protein